MLAALGPILTYLVASVPALTSSTQVIAGVKLFSALAPVIAEAAPQLLQQAKNVIGAFRAHPLTPTEQLDELDRQEVVIDAAWKKANDRATAEDEAADKAAAGGT